MIRLLWYFRAYHRWLGHTVAVYAVTVPMFDEPPKIVLYRCECGELWAK